MIIRVVLEYWLCETIVLLCYLNLKVLVEVFVPKDDIIRVLSFVISNFLQIGVHLFRSSIVIKRRLSRPQFILIVWVLMRVVGARAGPKMACTIVIKVLFVRWSPENCPWKAILLSCSILDWLNFVTLICRFYTSQRRIRWSLLHLGFFGSKKATMLWCLSFKEIFFWFIVKTTLRSTKRGSWS